MADVGFEMDPPGGVGRLSVSRRHFSRLMLWVLVGGVVLVVLGACVPVSPLQLTVTTSADGRDLSPGDGRCEMTAGVGDCSLRAAIDEANAQSGTNARIITLGSGVNPLLTIAGRGDDVNATGDFDVMVPLTIDGGGGTIDGGSKDRVFDLRASVTLKNLTIRGGAPGSAVDGGGIRTTATLLVDHSTVSNNQVVSSGRGGGVFGDAGSEMTIRDSTVASNAAPQGGGVSSVGVLHVERATLSTNSASSGAAGGVHFSGTEGTISSSTLSGNAGTSVQGGAGQMHLVHVTVSSGPVGLSSAGGTIDVAASVLSSPVGAVACSSGVTSRGWNVSADLSCGLREPTDEQGVAVGLGSLGDNGGPTRTQLLAANSPGVDRIPSATAGLCDSVNATDQRGSPRPVAAGCDSGAVEGGGAPMAELEFVVDTSADGSDVSIGDGVCNRGDGTCSLRAAVSEANLSNGSTTIIIGAGVNPTLSIAGANENANSTGDLDITGYVTIVGNGAAVDGAHFDRVFDVRSRRLRLDHLTVRNGDVGSTGSGGGGIANGADLELVTAIVSGNVTRSTSGGGGGIASTGRLLMRDRSNVSGNQTQGTTAHGGGIVASGIATIDDSIVADNASSGLSSRGGGIYALGSLSVTRSNISRNQAGSGGAVGSDTTATVTIRESAMLQNSASGYGGAVYSLGATSVVNSTIAGNRLPVSSFQLGAAVFSGPAGAMSIRLSSVVDNGSATSLSGTRVSVTGTLLRATPGASVCSSGIVSMGWNVLTDTTCGFSGPSDHQLANPIVFSLAANGGPTPTFLPALDSPLLDAIPAGTAGLCDSSTPNDQRGSPRPSGGGCDIGAVEGHGPAAPPLSLLVDDPTDAGDTQPGDGTCTTPTGSCTLRAAVDETNVYPASDAIRIAPGVNPQLSRAGAGEDANVSGDLDVFGWLTIDGGGATVDGRGLDRVVHQLGGTLKLNDLALVGGQVGINDLGGALWVTGSVSADRLVLADNHAGDGSAIYGSPLSLVELANCWVTGNASDAYTAAGGGSVLSRGASLTLRDCTVSGNIGPTRGGGVTTYTTPLRIESSTIEANLGGPGVQVLSSASLTMTGTTVRNSAKVGIAIDHATATITDSTVTGSYSYGIYAVSSAAGLDRVTVSDNLYGVYGSTSVVVVDASRIERNRGPGLYAENHSVLGPVGLELEGTLVSGNAGAGLHAASATVNVTNSTFDANGASSSPASAVVSRESEVTVRASTFARNRTPNPAAPAIGPDIYGNGVGEPVRLIGSVLDPAPGTRMCKSASDVSSGGWNVAADKSCDLSAAGDQSGTYPMLGVLGEHGGPTPTRLPYAGAPVVDAIPAGTPILCDGSIPTDARGVSRPSGAACDIGAIEGSGPTLAPLQLTVNDPSDIHDASPGDRVCATATGTCTLRAAIDETNTYPTADTVTVSPGLSPRLTLSGTNEEDNQTGDLDIDGDLTIDGNNTVLDANRVDRAIDEFDGTLTIRNLGITGGYVPTVWPQGGGLRTNGTVTLERVSVSGNEVDLSATSGSGGGIHQNGGNLTLRETTISNNRAYDVSALAITGQATIESSTISSNSSKSIRKTISLAGGAVTVRNSTIVTLNASSAFEGWGTLTIGGSILAKDGTGFASCSGLDLTSTGYNLFTDNCPLTQTGDQQLVDPLLGVLADNGGPTQTHALLPGSPAINRIPFGTNGLCDVGTHDQRGVPRPQGTQCDVGAVEQ